MTDTGTPTSTGIEERPPIEVRIAMTIRRLHRLTATAATPTARIAAASGARLLQRLTIDPDAAQRTMKSGFVRATTIAELWFVMHIAHIFGLAVRMDGWQQRGGVDWGGTPELMRHAAAFAHEYLPGFQTMLSDAAQSYMNKVLPFDDTVLN